MGSATTTNSSGEGRGGRVSPSSSGQSRTRRLRQYGGWPASRLPRAVSLSALALLDNLLDLVPSRADADGARVKTILRSREPIMSPSWSPDGTKIAYVSFEQNGLPKIYVHNLGSAERRVVAQFKGINGAPAWSPDGQKLALTLSKGGNPDIYSLDLNNGDLEQMTEAVHVATAIRGGASLVHGIQMMELARKKGMA